MSPGRVKMVGSSGRVAIFGDPTLTVIKIYMSGRVKMSGRRVGSGRNFVDPRHVCNSEAWKWF